MTMPTIILGLLVGPLLLLTVAGRLVNREFLDAYWRGCLGLALVFCFTGVGHFIETEAMAEMLPGWVPGRMTLVYVTGVIELAVAFAILIPRLRRVVGWSIILMLVLFLPANIYAAVHHVGMGGHQWGPVYLLIRIPLQAILIGWTWWFAVRPFEMEPVTFSCEANWPTAPDEIARKILDVSRWPDFQGYGVLPGIKLAEFEVETPQVVGSRVRVSNTDGSSHVEEVAEWEPGRQVRLHIHEFSAPFSRLATALDETWEFQRNGAATKVVRTFELYPRSPITRPILWLISFLLRKAVDRHLRQMRERLSGA